MPKRTEINIKLPRTRGGRKLKHPMLELFEKMSAVDIAKKLEIDRTSVYYYVTGAQANRDFPIAGELVLRLAAMSKIHPYYWRPDLYPKIGITAVDTVNEGA